VGEWKGERMMHKRKGYRGLIQKCVHCLGKEFCEIVIDKKGMRREEI
jgi:hypothetical protein